MNGYITILLIVNIDIKSSAVTLSLYEASITFKKIVFTTTINFVTKKCNQKRLLLTYITWKNPSLI